mmetsp:Transcript_50948/g.166492  ORF Transcript_50948/g.166492 Transcript_50948/m.166492 type:complete len:231 (+) Transcript_50948:221-913(+)
MTFSAAAAAPSSTRRSGSTSRCPTRPADRRVTSRTPTRSRAVSLRRATGGRCCGAGRATRATRAIRCGGACGSTRATRGTGASRASFSRWATRTCRTAAASGPRCGCIATARTSPTPPTGGAGRGLRTARSTCSSLQTSSSPRPASTLAPMRSAGSTRRRCRSADPSSTRMGWALTAPQSTSPPPPTPSSHIRGPGRATDARPIGTTPGRPPKRSTRRRAHLSLSGRAVR